jgi:hypothetical protein
MLAIFWTCFGAVWLYFWLRGHWFAATIGTLFAAVLWVLAGHFNVWPAGVACTSWVPFFGWRAFRKIRGDVRKAWEVVL